jgi:hypothetical protein
MFYWVILTDGRHGTVETEGEETLEEVVKTVVDGTIKTSDQIPYPARPPLRRVTDTPEFCYSPNYCKGRTACPRGPSCTS